MSVSIVFVSLLVSTAMMGSITSTALNSPCPELFHYHPSAEPGKWSGTVTLLSDSDLHGVWVRLIFDRKLAAIQVSDDFGEIVPSINNQEFLIKNRNVLLKAETPVAIKITVKYEGDTIPRLIGYRLNAKMVCSIDNINALLPFASDFHNEGFLGLVNRQNLSVYNEIEGCGTTTLKTAPFPWQSALFHESSKGTEFLCEATLISSRHVLTPAHCVTYEHSETIISRKNLLVYFSEKNGKISKYRVAKLILNPGYRANGLLNDLAVVQLDSYVLINDYVRPICLGDLGKKSGVLVGYKITQKARSDDLSHSNVEIISDCKELSGNLKGLLSDNVVCAKYTEDNSNCVGSSGSSFVSRRDNSKDVWELQALTTVGVALQNKYACDRSSVVLLIDISRYLKWIHSVLV